VLSILCYALLLLAFGIDLFTPQPFIAAIFLNVPVALSSLALSRRLTIALVVAAETANIVAGYVNGIQTGGDFNPIAISNRMLLAASFVLVGFMAIKTQQLARTAGLSEAREEQARRERALRLALDRVRESLNIELVLRAIVREAIPLLGAQSAMLVIDTSPLESPKRYIGVSGEREVTIDEVPLPAEVRSFLARDWSSGILVRRRGDDRTASYALETLNSEMALATVLRVNDRELRLILTASTQGWDNRDTRLLKSFAEQCEIALAQAQLFTRVSEQALQIAEQHETLVERSNVIRDIVYALAHDLRTPLSAVNVTIHQAQRGAYGDLPKTYQDVLSTTLRSNEELQRLVETLLLVARYESGEASNIREPVDLCKVARQVVAELEPTARERNLVLNVQGGPASVIGDENEMRRAAVNLVANAIAASPPGTSVTIRTWSDGQDVHFIVDDEGFGVPPEQRPTLFERFGATNRKRGSSSGLGLYIVRLIVAKHRGTAHYEPRDKGSRFGFVLPSASESV
jgi:signal transduction histidine kinase